MPKTQPKAMKAIKAMKVMKAMKAMKAMKVMKVMKAPKKVKTMKADVLKERILGFPKRLYFTGKVPAGLATHDVKGRSYRDFELMMHEEWVQYRDDTTSYRERQKDGSYFGSRFVFQYTYI